MATARRKIQPKDLDSLKELRAMQGFIERLYLVGTQRDKASNRELHMDQFSSSCGGDTMATWRT
jgi:hypothetical protein